MAKVIEFKNKSCAAGDNLITSKPWIFLRAEWENKYFIQMLRSYWDRLDSQPGKNLDLPPHYVLKDSMACTIHGIYNYRNNIEKMREVYYLAGLIDCMINQVNPLLRTDLIKTMYKKVTTLKGVLDVNWYGHMDQVLFPIDIRFYNHDEYRDGLSKAETMKELYRLIRDGTSKMFDILSSEYVFFTPLERA